MYKELLEYIAKKLVQESDKVTVTEENRDTRLVLKLTVAKVDMGRIIGKDGRIIRSIRELINSYAMKDSKKVTVEVEEIKSEDE